MNISSLVGIIAALAVFAVSLYTATDQREIFLDPHGILIVIGGTLAASMISFPVLTLLSMVRVFFQKILGKPALAQERVIKEIVTLSQGVRVNPQHLKESERSIKDPFLREAVGLLNGGGMTEGELDAILRKRTTVIFKRHDREAQIFRSIGRFPPAFGLMGTTLGMVALLQKLGTPDSYKALGPAMAIGLIATLYGIALTNLVLVPIAENLTRINHDDELLRLMVLDGIKLLRARAHPLVVEESLKSYLLPKERARLTKIAVSE